MPRYVKNGRVIFASKLAYDAIYQEQGFLPFEEENHTEDEEDNGLVGENENNKPDDIEDEDDYGDDEDEGENGGDIDPNENMPLAARVGMLSYEQLKEKAKELGIPKYANIKREELQTKVIEALETENAQR